MPACYQGAGARGGLGGPAPVASCWRHLTLTPRAGCGSAIAGAPPRLAQRLKPSPPATNATPSAPRPIRARWYVGGFNASVGMPDLEEPGLMARLLRAACPVPVGPGGQLAEGCCGGTRAGGWCAWTGAWAWAVQERCWPTTHPPPLGALLRGPNASGRAAWCLVRRCIRTTAVAAVGRRRAAPSAASTSSS